MPDKQNQDIVFAEERRERIAGMLEASKRVSVTELCDEFDVSAATIRSDLRAMQQAGLLTRTHGGAIARSQTAFEQKSPAKRVQHVTEKKRIAEAALAIIQNGDTILLDTGTTTMELARQLHRRKDLKVVTNDLDIARMLEDTAPFEVIVLGGMLRRGFHCTIGYLGLMDTTDLRVDKAFLGANAFSVDNGATTPAVQQAETKRAMLAMANQSILLCDSSKIGNAAFARFAPATAFDVLITDALTDEQQTQLQELAVDVVIA